MQNLLLTIRASKMEIYATDLERQRKKLLANDYVVLLHMVENSDCAIVSFLPSFCLYFFICIRVLKGTNKWEQYAVR